MVSSLLTTVARTMRALLFLPLIAALACSEERADPIDAGRSDSGRSDSGSTDAGSTDSGPDAGQPDSGFEAPVSCPAGSTIEHYSLTPLQNLPRRGDLEFPNLIGAATIDNAGTGEANSARFDVCRTANNDVVFQAFLMLGDDGFSPILIVRDETISSPMEDAIQVDGGYIFRVRMPANRLLVTGLTEAINGNLQPLEIRVVHETGLLILGHASFVGIARGNVTANSIDYTAIQILVGGLAPGDIFATRRCPLGQAKFDRSFQLGTATFAVEACTYLGGGFTTGYDITKLIVTDTNAALSPAEREPMAFEGKAAVEAVMNYRWNHHNACDSFYLQLPHAEYAATTSPAAGCGIPVENAPPRSIDEDPIRPVQYRIRYRGGAWVEGEMANCTHYLFCM